MLGARHSNFCCLVCACVVEGTFSHLVQGQRFKKAKKNWYAKYSYILLDGWRLVWDLGITKLTTESSFHHDWRIAALPVLLTALVVAHPAAAVFHTTKAVVIIFHAAETNTQCYKSIHVFNDQLPISSEQQRFQNQLSENRVSNYNNVALINKNRNVSLKF